MDDDGIDESTSSARAVLSNISMCNQCDSSISCRKVFIIGQAQHALVLLIGIIIIITIIMVILNLITCGI
jgi:hypothetical protein